MRRYKRFLADVETEDGRVLTVHCPNPGSMLGLDRPGSPVRCSTSDDPRRKLAHTLEMIQLRKAARAGSPGHVWVGLHTLRANQLVRLALERGAVRGLAGYRSLRPEATTGRARIDFRLDDHPRRPERACWVEVKSVTLARGRLARFPDSVTERGRRHLEVLGRLRGTGARAVLLFVVQRADCERVAPADDIDPAYGRALRTAARRGVEIRAVRTRVSPRGIELDRALPVSL